MTTIAKPTIGLFGTCGGSRWRDPFIARYEADGIPYFNPQVEDWTPECAAIEAEHLATDPILLFPVTDETYGTGSLAEVGFAAARVKGTDRALIIYIAPEVAPDLAANVTAAKESNRARRLVLTHLYAGNLANVHIALSLEDMLRVSRTFYRLRAEA